MGATTKRGRSVGYLDLAWLKYAIRINGSKYLAMNKLDILDGLNQIKVLSAYRFEGRTLAPGTLPDERRLNQIVPVYETVDGWSESTYGCEDWGPAAVQSPKLRPLG
jgi:adenylosuccinate synthase